MSGGTGTEDINVVRIDGQPWAPQESDGAARTESAEDFGTQRPVIIVLQPQAAHEAVFGLMLQIVVGFLAGAGIVALILQALGQ